MHSDAVGLRARGVEGGANDDGGVRPVMGTAWVAGGAVRAVAGLCGWLWELRGRLSGVADGGGAVRGTWTAVGPVHG